MVRPSYESSLVVKVKSKQYFDPLFMELKDLVLSKFNKSFCQEGGTKVDCVYRMLII